MGIPKLTAFIKEKFTRWKKTNFQKWDHVVIDGNNVCYNLYKKNFPWTLGGEYDKFRTKIKEFFETAEFKNPIVVFDGTQYEPEKMNTIRQRRIDYMVEIRELQKGCSWDTGLNDDSDGDSDEKTSDASSEAVVPLLILSTFIQTLKEIRIDCHVADGEADREIAALANYYKCPVLGSDSDFFIFNLKYGFIFFDRFCSKEEHERDKPLYLLKSFKKQCELKKKEMCLLIPAFFGNDFLKITRKDYDYESFLTKLSMYKNCDDYLDSKDNRIHRKEFKDIKKFYWDFESLYCPESLDWPLVSKSKYFPSELPVWVYADFKKGKFSIQLLDAYIHKASILPHVVEAIQYNSAWKISRYIRERLYHIMGISVEVKETTRRSKSARLATVAVPPVSLRTPVSIQEELFLFKVKYEEKLSDLVLAVLKCHKLSQEDITTIFNRLSDEFKLPIAATIYWYRSLDDPPSKRDLVAPLLISFFMCSGTFPRVFLPVSDKTKGDHLRALHAFAQWQCVYHDAMALNYLAREPFHTTNPASLYSGKVAMHYASQKPEWLDELFPRKDSPKWKRLNQLLYLITGRDEEGRVGQHEIKPKLIFHFT